MVLWLDWKKDLHLGKMTAALLYGINVYSFPLAPAYTHTHTFSNMVIAPVAKKATDRDRHCVGTLLSTATSIHFGNGPGAGGKENHLNGL